MKCPICNSLQTRCSNSREAETCERIRTFKCQDCKAIFHTKETILIKPDKVKETA